MRFSFSLIRWITLEDIKDYNNNPLNIPKADCLVDHNGMLDSNGEAIDYHLVGDDGFGISLRLMKPYSGRSLTPSQDIFNYRLSRARQVVEVAFGILACRFRCLFNKLYASPENAKLVIETSVLLHNYLLSKKPLTFQEQKSAKDDWYHLLLTVGIRNYTRPHVNSNEMRNYLRNYFISEYPINSQYDSI